MTRKQETAGSRAPRGVRPEKTWIVEHLGDEAFRIFDALPSAEAEGKTDFDLATSLELSLNHVRRGLYLLEENRLAKRREHGRSLASSPTGYTYHARRPVLPLDAPEKKSAEVEKRDTPDCYDWV